MALRGGCLCSNDVPGCTGRRTQLFPAGVSVTVRDPRAGKKVFLAKSQHVVPAAFNTGPETEEFQAHWTYCFCAPHKADIALLG